MPKILVSFRQDVRHTPVACYPKSYGETLERLGHTVTYCGEGHPVEHLEQVPELLSYDLILEIENGRNKKGNLAFQVPEYFVRVPKAVILIDTHGFDREGLHRELAKKYDYVFFAVWSKRHVFVEHPSAHWLPNCTDLKWFDYKNFPGVEARYDVGFHSSKKGLSRALNLIDICRKNHWSYDIREVVKAHRHRWPATGEAMRGCKVLFNRGQRGDGPNQRVLESMAICRPLVSDSDPTSGMSRLFEDGRHYLAYKKGNVEDLEDKVRFLLENPKKANEIAQAGYEECSAKHTVKQRAKSILEVVGIE